MTQITTTATITISAQYLANAEDGGRLLLLNGAAILLNAAGQMTAVPNQALRFKTPITSNGG